MELSSVVQKHDDQITNTRDSLAKLNTDMSVMLAEHKHLLKQISEILEMVKKNQYLPYKIESLENQVQTLTSSTTSLENLISEKTNLSGRLSSSVKKWWPVWLALSASAGFIGDMLYKLPPPS